MESSMVIPKVPIDRQAPRQGAEQRFRTGVGSTGVHMAEGGWNPLCDFPSDLDNRRIWRDLLSALPVPTQKEQAVRIGYTPYA
jgi:hypothetical protein